MKKNLIIFATICLALCAGNMVNGFAAESNSTTAAITKLDKDTPSGWFDELDKAQAYAAKEKKLILLLFTGSDWCPYCVKLHDDVLSKDDFKKYAAENLALVYLDYPREKKLPDAITKQNAPLPAKYNVDGYPCSILMSADMKTEYGRISGYSKQFLTMLKSYVDEAGKSGAGVAIGAKATLDDLKKVFDYLPETIGTIGTDKIPRTQFFEFIVGNDLAIVKAISQDREQVKELLKNTLDIKAMDKLIAQSGLKANADMYRTLLKKQCEIMPPAAKADLLKSLKDNGIKTLDAFIEDNVKKQEGHYEDMLPAAYKFNLAETLAQKEISSVTDKDIKEFYDKNQSACTVDGKVLPLDTPLKATIKKMIAIRKAAEIVPEELKSRIEALDIKVSDISEKKK